MVVNGVGDMALGAIDIYRTFTDPESKQLRGNFAEGYKYMTGNEAAGWVDYADMGAGLVGSFSGIAPTTVPTARDPVRPANETLSSSVVTRCM